ncbi:hypothetical protein EI94DRAFT_1808625 [Lactarius quietus]|nr:hypothetical protein EI94DRAFT_1808625 [Lactarius quietus]
MGGPGVSQSHHTETYPCKLRMHNAHTRNYPLDANPLYRRSASGALLLIKYRPPPASPTASHENDNSGGIVVETGTGAGPAPRITQSSPPIHIYVFVSAPATGPPPPLPHTNAPRLSSLSVPLSPRLSILPPNPSKSNPARRSREIIAFLGARESLFGFLEGTFASVVAAKDRALDVCESRVG